MSGTAQRENVFATRMALTNTKLRLKGAHTGHSLLAKKRDALMARFRLILRKVDEVRWIGAYSPIAPRTHSFFAFNVVETEYGKSDAARFVFHG
jgi:vacuolar-type H+-ATPase subunit D/Vma8